MPRFTSQGVVIVTHCEYSRRDFEVDGYAVTPYRIRKVKGQWHLTFRDNAPIECHSFGDAIDALDDLLRLTGIRNNTKRGNLR